MASQFFVLDTSVILDDPNCIDAYRQVLIPLQVIEELDNTKTHNDKAGHNARVFLKTLESAPKGVTIQDCRTSKTALGVLEAHGFDVAKADHQILAAALDWHNQGLTVTLVSNDTALRVKTKLTGLATRNHPVPQIHERTGIMEAVVPDLYDGPESAPLPSKLDLLENEFVVVPDTGLLYRRKGDRLHKVKDEFKPYKLSARGLEQVAALDLLADRDLPLVVLRGKSGSGKTALALAAGLHQSGQNKPYERTVVLRPVTVVGREELGFLPGKLQEKLDPHFQVVRQLLKQFNPKEADGAVQKLIDSHRLSLEPISYLRGVTLSDTFVILDESQNVDKTTVKTVMSRIGPGSKLVITGDFNQIDAGYLNARTCGISHVVEKLTGNPLFGTVHFNTCQRSPLANLADEVL